MKKRIALFLVFIVTSQILGCGANAAHPPAYFDNSYGKIPDSVFVVGGFDFPKVASSPTLTEISGDIGIRLTHSIDLIARPSIKTYEYKNDEGDYWSQSCKANGVMLGANLLVLEKKFNEEDHQLLLQPMFGFERSYIADIYSTSISLMGKTIANKYLTLGGSVTPYVSMPTNAKPILNDTLPGLNLFSDNDVVEPLHMSYGVDFSGFIGLRVKNLFELSLSLMAGICKTSTYNCSNSGFAVSTMFGH